MNQPNKKLASHETKDPLSLSLPADPTENESDCESPTPCDPHKDDFESDSVVFVDSDMDVIAMDDDDDDVLRSAATLNVD